MRLPRVILRVVAVSLVVVSCGQGPELTAEDFGPTVENAQPQSTDSQASEPSAVASSAVPEALADVDTGRSDTETDSTDADISETEPGVGVLPRETSQGIAITASGPQEELLIEALADGSGPGNDIDLRDRWITPDEVIRTRTWVASSEITLAVWEVSPEVGEVHLTTVLEGAVDVSGVSADGYAYTALYASHPSVLRAEAYDHAGNLIAECEYVDESSFFDCE